MNDALSAPARPKILFVDDEEKSRKYFHRLFGEDYEILQAEDPQQSLKVAASNPDLKIIVSDQRMPNGSGTELLSHLQKSHPRAVRILSTAYSDYESVVDAINMAHVFAYFSKPWDVEFISRTFKRALEIYDSGNPLDSSLQINERRSSDLSRITLSLKDVPDVQAILSMSQSILSKRVGVNREDPKINLVSTPDDLIILFDNPNDNNEHVASLASFRRHYELSEEAHQAIIAPHSPRLSPKHAEQTLSNISAPSTKAAPIPASTAVTIKNTLDGLQTQLARLNAEIHGLTKMQGLRAGLRLNKLKTDLKDLIDRTRDLCFAQDLEKPALDEAVKVTRSFLDDINNNRNGLRELLISGAVDPAHITIIFVFFNGLPQGGFTSRMEPDVVMMNLARAARDKVENKSMVIVAAFLALPLLGVFLYFVEKSGQLTGKALTFAFVVVVALVTGALAAGLAGKLGVDGKIPLPGVVGKSVSVKSTSGFGIFVLVFVVGCFFLL